MVSGNTLVAGIGCNATESVTGAFLGMWGILGNRVREARLVIQAETEP